MPQRRGRAKPPPRGPRQRKFAMAEASLKSTTASYTAGMATISELLDVQAQWHTARADLSEARTNLQIHVIDYRAATAKL